jgi:hypothetical protein
MLSQAKRRKNGSGQKRRWRVGNVLLFFTVPTVADVENRQLELVEEEDDNFIFQVYGEEDERVELPKDFFGSKAAFLKGTPSGSLLLI